MLVEGSYRDIEDHKGGGMKASELRKKLRKIMPGYNWTIHRQISKGFLEATGTISSGYNRLSTLNVIWRKIDGMYEVKSSGFGQHAPWLESWRAVTLAQALRELQNIYESRANNYGVHARALREARKS